MKRDNLDFFDLVFTGVICWYHSWLSLVIYWGIVLAGVVLIDLLKEGKRG